MQKPWKKRIKNKNEGSTFAPQSIFTHFPWFPIIKTFHQIFHILLWLNLLVNWLQILVFFNICKWENRHFLCLKSFCSGGMSANVSLFRLSFKTILFFEENSSEFIISSRWLEKWMVNDSSTIKRIQRKIVAKRTKSMSSKVNANYLEKSRFHSSVVHSLLLFFFVFFFSFILTLDFNHFSAWFLIKVDVHS